MWHEKLNHQVQKTVIYNEKVQYVDTINDFLIKIFLNKVFKLAMSNAVL